jgi:putative membrane protein
MRNFVIRLIINAIALAGAAYLVDGIELAGSFTDVLFVAFVFGLVNALVKPIVFFFSLPFLFLSLGLLAFVLNGALLLLTAKLVDNFSVDGLGTAILGSVVISVISMVMGVILRDEKDRKD